MSGEHEHKPDVGDRVAVAEPVAGATSGAQPSLSPHCPATDGPVVVPHPESAHAPLVAPPRAAPQPQWAQVRVAPHVLNLLAIAASVPKVTEMAHEQRELNAVVHGVLIAGLAISTALMVAGLGLGLIYQRDLPVTVPDLGEVFQRVVTLRPSGFLALGLLVLIATPILRVIGSIGAFVYERDWRFAGVTTLVLLVLLVSLVLGHG